MSSLGSKSLDRFIIGLGLKVC
jgi:hypothetical protein